MELCEKRNDVKRDIIGFRASLEGLRRMQCSCHWERGSSRRLFVELFPLSCKINYVHP